MIMRHGSRLSAHHPLAGNLIKARNSIGIRKRTMPILIVRFTIKGGSRRAEKSRKVLMMMKAAKLGWTGTRAGKKQGWTKSRARKGRSRGGAGQK